MTKIFIKAFIFFAYFGIISGTNLFSEEDIFAGIKTDGHAEIILKNNKSFKGIITKITEDKITLDTSYDDPNLKGKITFDKKNIQKIIPLSPLSEEEKKQVSSEKKSPPKEDPIETKKIPDEEPIPNTVKALTIQGQVVDGTGLNSLGNIEIRISIQEIKPGSTQNDLYNDRQLTDGNGRYMFKDISGNFFDKDYQVIFRLFEDRGSKDYKDYKPKYDTAGYYLYISKTEADKISHINLDFNLHKSGDNVTVCGKIFKDFDNSPLPDIKLSITQDSAAWTGSKNTKSIGECQTDRQGYYEVKAPAVNYQNSAYPVMIGEVITIKVNDENYEIIKEISYDSAAITKERQTIRGAIDFTKHVRDFYLMPRNKFAPNERGTIRGTLDDKNGRPLARTSFTFKVSNPSASKGG